MIKIGIEADAAELHNQLLAYPERYFFILITDGRPALCVQTCDNCGDNIKIQEVDGLEPNSEGDLSSVFFIDLQEAVIERELYMKYLEGERYPVSQALRRRIIELPGFVDWIIESSHIKGRCLMLCPSWCI